MVSKVRFALFDHKLSTIRRVYSTFYPDRLRDLSSFYKFANGL